MEEGEVFTSESQLPPQREPDSIGVPQIIIHQLYQFHIARSPGSLGQIHASTLAVLIRDGGDIHKLPGAGKEPLGHQNEPSLNRPPQWRLPSQIGNIDVNPPVLQHLPNNLPTATKRRPVEPGPPLVIALVHVNSLKTGQHSVDLEVAKVAGLVERGPDSTLVSGVDVKQRVELQHLPHQLLITAS